MSENTPSHGDYTTADKDTDTWRPTSVVWAI